MSVNPTINKEVAHFTPPDLKCALEDAVVGEGLCDVTEGVDNLLLSGRSPCQVLNAHPLAHLVLAGGCKQGAKY